MSTDRRTFLKLAAAGAAALGLGAAEAARPGRSLAGAGAFRWAKAPCRFCGAGCGMQIGVEAGRVVAVAGDPDAPVNKGLLCVKGYHAGAVLYGADRLTTPLLRREGVLRPVSWEVAIRTLADRIAANPAGFAFWGSGQLTVGEAYLAQKFVKAGLGNNNVVSSSRFADTAADAAARAVYGEASQVASFDDLDVADVLLTWSANPAEEHPVLFTRFTDRRLGGEDLTVIDVGTRRTRTTAAAQAFIRCRPHTEDAVLKGILHLLIEDEAWDKAFVDANCALRIPGTAVGAPPNAGSIEQWRAVVAPYTPDAVQRLTEVRPADLQKLAALFARKDVRIVSLWSEAINERSQGLITNLLLHTLHLFTGHYGRPGDGPLVLSAAPSVAGSVVELGLSPDGLPAGLLLTADADRALAEGLWGLPPGRISPKAGLEPVPLWKRFAETAESGGDVTTLWVMAANPAQTLPNAAALFDPSRKDPDKFLVVSDIYPTPTTMQADLVLPAALWVEKNGVYGNLERRAQQWSRLVAPPGDARDDAWQVLAVAWELFRRGFAGMKTKEGGFLLDFLPGVAAWDWAKYKAVNVDRAIYEDYRRFTEARLRPIAAYDTLVACRGLRWPVLPDANDKPTETARRYVAQGEKPDAPRVRFSQSPSGDGRAHLWLSADVPSGEVTDTNFPLYLTTGPVLEHSGSGSLTGRIPQLRTAMPRGYLEMNRQDANRLGIESGEMVTVESRRGSMRVAVWIEGRSNPAPGHVFAPVFDQRLRANALLSEAEVEGVGELDLGSCAVRVQRVVG